MPARLVAVNVVHELVPDTLGSLDKTAIDKRPVDGRVRVGPVGLEGDDQYDTANHGGPDQALYAYAREDAAWWSRQLGREVMAGQFGENFTTEGIDVTGALIGERWRVGDDGVLLETTFARIPCATFQGWMDEPQWVRRFTQAGFPGAYLRVVAGGTVGAGDDIVVVDRPDHEVTVGETLVVRRTDADRLRRLLERPGLPVALADAIERDLAARATTP